MLPSDRQDVEPIHYSRYWMAKFLPEVMIDSLMTFADEMNSYQLSFLELNILKTILIVCPGIFFSRLNVQCSSTPE
jgi:hypothetical protein